MEIIRNRERIVANTIEEIHNEVQLQQRRENIQNLTYNQKYKYLIPDGQYLSKQEIDCKIIAPFLLGNEGSENLYWKSRRKCRIYRIETENLEHLRNNSVPNHSNTGSVSKLVNETQPDVAWMKEVKRRRDKHNINK